MNDGNEGHLLTSRQAREMLDNLMGEHTQEHVFYNRIRDGVLIPHTRQKGGRLMLFREEDIQSTAQQLKQAREAQREYTLSTQEALAYLAEHGHPMKRSTFHKLVRTLVQQGIISQPRMTAHPKRPNYLFSQRTLDRVLAYMQEQAQRIEPDWMTPRQAAAYLSKKYKRPITIDLVYHKINREQIIPVHQESNGKNKQYFLAQEDVDKLAIAPARRKQPQELQEREPVESIRYIQELKDLEKKYHSPILTKFGVLKIFKERTGKDYTEEALKQMRRRGTFEPKAQIGRTLLYLKKDAETVHLLPNTGRRVPTKPRDALSSSEEKEEEPHAVIF